MAEAQLILMPGLGADARLLSPQKAAFGDALITPDWPEPEGDEPLEPYARRWGEALKGRLDPGRPVFLGGVSFGGIVAMHMADALHPEAVILVASCRSSDDVPLRFEAAQRLGAFVSDAGVARLLPLLALPFAVADGLDSDHTGLLRRMARDADPAMLRWAGRAVAGWSFAVDDGPACPVYRVHGRHDWVIPFHGEPDDRTEVLANGRHLINLTLDRTVNAFVRRVVAGHGASLPDKPVGPPVNRDTPRYLAAPA